MACRAERHGEIVRLALAHADAFAQVVNLCIDLSAPLDAAEDAAQCRNPAHVSSGFAHSIIQSPQAITTALPSISNAPMTALQVSKMSVIHPPLHW